MGKLYDSFKEAKKRAPGERISEKVGLVRFDKDGKRYEIYYSRRRANKYSILHCVNHAIEWEQVPVLPRIVGRMYGLRVPILQIVPEKNCVRVFVVRGKPNYISGLDDGIFRSVHKYDEAYVNVMSEARFKEI